MSQAKNNVSRPGSWAGLGHGLMRFLDRLRCAVLSAVVEEAARGSAVATISEDADLFDRLPDPPPHLDIGDVKYFDGKFRYF